MKNKNEEIKDQPITIDEQPVNNLNRGGVGLSLSAATSQKEVDTLNTEFYRKITYPWPPMSFKRVTQKMFWSKMLGQDIGSWDKPIVPENGSIWVAGCGTNQALITALKFPEARVLGSDLSETSLEICKQNADQLAVANLELKKESINDINYTDQFEYILCTGVIHHNADPAIPLSHLSKALKPDGVLELMVYNQYHRVFTAAFQTAIRTLLGTELNPNLDKELPIAKNIIQSFTNSSFMPYFLKKSESVSDIVFCDFLLQPVEHSYSIDSLDALARDCNLELLTFAVDQFSKEMGQIDWNLRFCNADLQRLYDENSDVKRWQITNHLMLESSPMLWFYLQRRDSPRPRKTEEQICDEFCHRTFNRTKTQCEIFVRNKNNIYQKTERRIPLVTRPTDEAVAYFYQKFDEFFSIDSQLSRLGRDSSFHTVNKLRINLATSAFPFLEVQS